MSVPKELLQSTAVGMATAIRDLLRQKYGEDAGFALLLFDHGASGSMAYASNASRDGMIKALLECVEVLRQNEKPQTPEDR